MSDEIVERWAIRLALGNNGGAWASHYNEDQKRFWRLMARDLLDDARSQFDRSIGQIAAAPPIAPGLDPDVSDLEIMEEATRLVRGSRGRQR